MKKVIRLTEDDLVRLVKKIVNENSEFNESYWNRIFGKPTVDDAAEGSMRAKGYSHRKTDDEDEQLKIVFDGEEFTEDRIQYASPYDMGEIPRKEGGNLIIANPAWRL